MRNKRARSSGVAGKPSGADHEIEKPTATIVRSTTEAQNAFGQVLADAAADNVIVITKRDAPEAVVMSFERYQALMAAHAPRLDALAAEFDELFAKMQAPETIAATTSWLEGSQPSASRRSARSRAAGKTGSRKP
jgi:prevent-host-death family protein